jgi:hypothetical protein
MKTLFGTDKYVLIALGAVASVVIISCAGMGRNHHGKVEITKDYIVLHKAVSLDPKDEKALNDVLSNYDKKLYLIDTVENGKITKTRGQLGESVLTAEVKEERRTVPTGFTHRQHQTICPAPCNPQFRPPTPAEKAEREKLIAQLKPILERYQ